MATFDLDPAAVSGAEQKMGETSETVNTQAGLARDAITNADWTGGAYTAANNKQNGEFNDAVQRLYGEMNRLTESLGLSRVGVENQDLESEESINAVPVELGNFGRI